jgi:glycerol-3-phosphate dehydrogenase (NAD+)
MRRRNLALAVLSLFGLRLGPWSFALSFVVNPYVSVPRNRQERLVGTALTSSEKNDETHTPGLYRPRRLRKKSLTQLSLNTGPPPYPVRVAVLGGGNFGLALAAICARKGIPVTLLVRDEAVADSINNKHRHPRYMSDLTLPVKIRATSNPAECLPDATYIIHAVPVQYSRKFLESVKDYIPPGTPILSGSKGIENASLGFMADILKECLGQDRPYAFLSGPSFAREMVKGVVTAVVVASEDLMLARDLADLLSDEAFRVYVSKDVIGVEIGGAVKNVIALAAGMCEGLGLGTNAMSGLVTRGCGEMRRLALTFGARPSTIAGLSGKFRPLGLESW